MKCRVARVSSVLRLSIAGAHALGTLKVIRVSMRFDLALL